MWPPFSHVQHHWGYDWFPWRLKRQHPWFQRAQSGSYCWFTIPIERTIDLSSPIPCQRGDPHQLVIDSRHLHFRDLYSYCTWSRNSTDSAWEPIVSNNLRPWVDGLNRASNGLWSVTKINLLSYNNWWNLFKPKSTANASFCIWL